jgi:hypothetical protein
MMEGVNLTMIYFKNFCKCHIVPSTKIIKNKIKPNFNDFKSNFTIHHLISLIIILYLY